MSPCGPSRWPLRRSSGWCRPETKGGGIQQYPKSRTQLSTGKRAPFLSCGNKCKIQTFHRKGETKSANFNLEITTDRKPGSLALATLEWIVETIDQGGYGFHGKAQTFPHESTSEKISKHKISKRKGKDCSYDLI